MAKLVILNQGMTGRSFDLNIERTTVGRVEDNTFHIADASVSSHHAEILLRGSDIVVRDIGSTNGTFINNEKITEAVLKPGQTLRFGQVELKLDDGTPLPAPAPAPAAASTSASAASAPAPAGKKPLDATLVIPRGISAEQLEQSGNRPTSFSTSTVFAKKKDKVNLYFIIGGAIAAVIIIGLIIWVLSQASPSPK